MVVVTTMLVRIAAVDEIPEGALRQIEVGGRNFAVCHVAGEIRVFEGDCPCAGGPVGQGKMFDGVMVCPWHGQRYSVESGECTTTPGLAIARFPVTIEAGEVFAEVDG
jgi:apoptosis-inducing factor 3